MQTQLSREARARIARQIAENTGVVTNFGGETGAPAENQRANYVN
jgi:hypothetical protein